MNNFVFKEGTPNGTVERMNRYIADHQQRMHKETMETIQYGLAKNRRPAPVVQDGFSPVRHESDSGKKPGLFRRLFGRRR